MSEYFNEEDEDIWDTETGKPGINLFASAVQVWACQQNELQTVEKAAEVFNVDPEMIREAVEHHYWMFLGGPDGNIIEHEGEDG